MSREKVIRLGTDDVTEKEVPMVGCGFAIKLGLRRLRGDDRNNQFFETGAFDHILHCWETHDRPYPCPCKVLLIEFPPRGLNSGLDQVKYEEIELKVEDAFVEERLAEFENDFGRKLPYNLREVLVLEARQVFKLEIGRLGNYESRSSS